MRYNFKFGDMYLSDLSAFVTKTPPIEVAEYDFTMLDIPGRNGSEYIDNKRYKNVEFTREIGFVNRASSHINDFVDKLIYWLAYSTGYQEFEDTDHPGLVTYAVLTNFREVQTLLRRYHTATLRFSRVPFWYSKQGLEPISLDSTSMLTGVTLCNPYPADAQPIYKFVLGVNSSAGNYFRLKVGDWIHLYTLSDLKYFIDGVPTRRYITFDCENKEIKAQSTEEGGNIAYAAIALPPDLKFGIDTTIKITENYNDCLLSMSITPRWRCL